MLWDKRLLNRSGPVQQSSLAPEPGLPISKSVRRESPVWLQSYRVCDRLRQIAYRFRQIDYRRPSKRLLMSARKSSVLFPRPWPKSSSLLPKSSTLLFCDLVENHIEKMTMSIIGSVTAKKRIPGYDHRHQIYRNSFPPLHRKRKPHPEGWGSFSNLPLN